MWDPDAACAVPGIDVPQANTMLNSGRAIVREWVGFGFAAQNDSD
jgi:hypothetical protein